MTNEERPRGIVTGGPNRLVQLALPIAQGRLDRELTEFVEDNPITSALVKRFPLLFDHKDKDKKEYRIKFNPHGGDVYIRSWRRKQKKSGIGQKPLPIDVGKREDDSAVRWSNWGDIEKTIRGVTHIIAANEPGGEAYENIRIVHDLTHRLFEDFTSGEITDENVEDYLSNAYLTLENAGLLKSKVQNRQNAVRQIMEALAKDNLDRFNPLISRTKLASASIKLLLEKLVSEQTVQKYNYLLSALLFVERDTERFYLEQVLEQALIFLNLPTNHKEYEKAKLHLESMAFEFLNPECIKVSPYRNTALLFLIYVFGFPEENAANWKYLFDKSFSRENRCEMQRLHKEDDSSPDPLARFNERLIHGISLIESILIGGQKNLDKLYAPKE